MHNVYPMWNSKMLEKAYQIERLREFYSKARDSEVIKQTKYV